MYPGLERYIQNAGQQFLPEGIAQPRISAPSACIASQGSVPRR